MKPTLVITTHTGSPCRIFADKERAEVVVADLPTGRVPAYLIQLVTRIPAIARHLRKLDVDGFTRGHHLGYVLPQEGLRELVCALQTINARDAKGTEAYQALSNWIAGPLTQALAEAREGQSGAPDVQESPRPTAVYLSTAVTQLTVNCGQEEIKFAVDGVVKAAYSPTNLFKILGLL